MKRFLLIIWWIAGLSSTPLGLTYGQDVSSYKIETTQDGNFLTVKDWKVCYSYNPETKKIGYGLCSSTIDFSAYADSPNLRLFETKKDAKKERRRSGSTGSPTDPNEPTEPSEPAEPTEPTVPTQPGNSEIVRTVLLPEWKPTQVRNYLNLDQFPDISSNDKLIFDWGYGAPVFQQMVTGNEPIQPYKKGWTHVWNASLLTRVQAPLTSKFTSDASLHQVADLLVKEGVPDAHFATSNEFAHGFGFISDQTAYDLGRRYYSYRTQRFNATAEPGKEYSEHNSLILFDHETAWSGNLISKMGQFAKGLNDASQGSINFLIYGSQYTATDFMIGDPAFYPLNQSEKNIKKAIDGYYGWSSPAFDGTNTFADFMWKYNQTPLPVQESIWKKNSDGSYKRDSNGKRVFRDDEFFENINGEVVNFLTTTEPLQREAWGRDENGSLKWQSYMSIPDVQLGVHEQYKQYDKFIVWNAARMRYLTNEPDVSRYSEKGVRPMMVLRTEKAGGEVLSNHRDTEPDLPHSPAEAVGQILIPMFSGAAGVSLWNNSDSGLPYGHPSSPKNKYLKNGEAQHRNGMNYAAYEASTAAIQAVTKAYDGVKFDATLRYLFFTKPLTGLNSRHMIACGFYQGNILNIAFYYPFQDYTEFTDVTITFAGKQITERIIGKVPVAVRYEVDVKGLEPDDFVIKYQTIDGDAVSETGAITF